MAAEIASLDPTTLQRARYPEDPPKPEYDDDDPGPDPANANDTQPPEPPSKLNIRWVRDCIAEPPPEPPMLVEGLIRRGEMAVFGAGRGIGKSWMAMNLAVLLSQGTGHLMGCLPVVGTATTLYSQGELTEYDSYQRWVKLTGDQPPEHVAETFDRWRIKTVVHRKQTTQKYDGIGMIDTDTFVDSVLDGRVETTIAEHGFDVLIIDPWATYFAGTENSNDETEAALDKLRDLTLRHGTTIIIFAHFGKNQEVRDPEDLWRGASRLADWASTRISLLPHYNDKQIKTEGMTRAHARRYVDVKFLRRAEPVDDISICWNPATGWWEHWIPPEEADGATPAPPPPRGLNIDQVAEICVEHGGAWPSLKAAADALHCSPGTAKDLCESAARYGRLEPWNGPHGGTGYRIPLHNLEEQF